MRVIAGQAKGCKLVAPLGISTRPTPERVREALFSMWGSMGALGRGLDAFAGSGAIGIEALSRGAPAVSFAESSVAALQALRANLARLPSELSGRATVLARPVADALRGALPGGPFDWVFVDPPFAADAYKDVMTLLASDACTNADTSLVVEHKSGHPLPDHPAWRCQRSRRFGSVTLSFFQKA